MTFRDDMEVHFSRFMDTIRTMSLFEWFIVAVSTGLTIGGSTLQLISLNMWLEHFEDCKGTHSFSIVTATTIFSFTMFTVPFVCRLVITRPKTAFIFTKRSMLLMMAIGTCNGCNGIFLVAASSNTPEILQAFLISSQIIWTLLFVKIILREDRKYMNPFVAGSFILSMGGILLGAAAEFGHTDIDANKIYWTLIYAGSMIPVSLYNVFNMMYLREFTERPEDAEHAAQKELYYECGEDAPVDDKPQSDPTTVKMCMLAFSTFFQVIAFAVFFPLNWAPWFSETPNVHEALTNIHKEYKCIYGSCHKNFLYYSLFAAGYVFTYLGVTFLNYYSATLASIVTQLAAPMSALTLIIVPAWNVSNNTPNVGYNLGATFLIIMGALLYTAWEQSTAHSENAAKKLKRDADLQTPFVNE